MEKGARDVKTICTIALFVIGCASSGVGISPRIPESQFPSPMLVMRDGAAIVRVAVFNYNDSQPLAGEVSVLADVAIQRDGTAPNQPPCSTDNLVRSQTGVLTGQSVSYIQACSAVHSVASSKMSAVLPPRGAKADVLELPIQQGNTCAKANSCRGWYLIKIVTSIPGTGQVVGKSQPVQFDLFSGQGVEKTE